MQPTWIDYTGNDTFWSVAVTGTAIYVGGHAALDQQPERLRLAGAGAVPRPGIVALDPVNGCRSAGTRAATRAAPAPTRCWPPTQGLYVGSDTD